MVMKTLDTLIKKDILTKSESEQYFTDILDNLALDENIQKNLKILFQCALYCGNPTLFPTVSVNKEEKDAPKEYIKKWVERYLQAIKHKPSARVATVKKAVDDPILKTMIKAEKNFDDKRVDMALDDHNLYMDAENIQGGLLEEYIDTHIAKLGWIWAEGEIIRASDFIKYDSNQNKYILLQIKNKYNSENSSSSAIRRGTEIKKWYRLGQQIHDKQSQPIYRWDKLNEIIGIEDEMSEKDYAKFIEQVAHKNPNLLI